MYKSMVKLLALALLALASSNAAADQIHESLVATDGFAENSINTTSFRQNSVTSKNGTQFVAFIDGQERVVLGKRQLGTDTWQTSVTQYSVAAWNAHNSVTIGIDGDGYLHVTWGMHNASLKYAKSTAPYGLTLTSQLSMIGSNETKVTYPQYFNLPDGRLVFMHRDGSSGNGDMVVNRYDPSTQNWTRLHSVLIDGEGQRNAYWQAAVDPTGRIHVSFVWRESSQVESNHDMGYARSDDGGVTWSRSDGTPYSLPITEANAEYAMLIPQSRELINQTSMAGDAAGRPYIATYFREAGSTIPQFWLIHHDGTSWNTQQIGARTTPFTLSGGGTLRIPISRPHVAVTHAANPEVHVLFRDEERGFKVSLASSSDLSSGAWNVRDLTSYSVDMWEPTFDRLLWSTDQDLHVYVQQVEQEDNEGSVDLDPTDVTVLEWAPDAPPVPMIGTWGRMVTLVAMAGLAMSLLSLRRAT